MDWTNRQAHSASSKRATNKQAKSVTLRLWNFFTFLRSRMICSREVAYFIMLSVSESNKLCQKSKPATSVFLHSWLKQLEWVWQLSTAYRIYYPLYWWLADCNQDDFFRYSAGRWLWSEEEQFAARYVRFNIQALCSVAAKSVSSTSCSMITKMPEGNFNKSFLVTMTDGKEVVAKVPNPNAGRPHFNTASEVATMDYVCRTWLFFHPWD